jgi:hypothetical protein
MKKAGNIFGIFGRQGFLKELLLSLADVLITAPIIKICLPYFFGGL